MRPCATRRGPRWRADRGGPESLRPRAARRPACSAGSRHRTALQRLITAVSRTILTAINRPSILPRSYTETREVGRSGVLLAQWPVTRVDGGRPWRHGAAPARARFGPDRRLRGRSRRRGAPGPAADAALRRRHADRLRLCPGHGDLTRPATRSRGGRFRAPGRGRHGVAPALRDLGERWRRDLSRRALPWPASHPPRAPASTPVDGVGGYAFAVTDAGRQVALTYGYVPADLANAAREWILERQAYAERIGLQSKSLGGRRRSPIASQPCRTSSPRSCSNTPAWCRRADRNPG